MSELEKAIKKVIKGAKGGEKPRTPVEAPNSLRSIAYARILDLVSEGPIRGLVNGAKSVFLDETPLQSIDNSFNFKNVQMDVRLGTQDQDYIPGFPSVENGLPIGLELRYGTPFTRAFSNLNLDAIRVTLSVPALSKTNIENGDVNGHTVGYAIDLSVDGGAFANVLSGNFSGKTTTKYERSHRIDLPKATSIGWTLRVRRTTINGSTVSVADQTFVESVTEIIDAKLRYPMSALIGLAIDASQFQNIPTRAYELYGREIRVPTNYNPDTREYTGVWDGTFKIAYTNNPAWCYYDLILHPRYGLGHLVKEHQLSKWDLYRIARYCDELVPDGFGGMEPRMTCNLYLQTQADAYKVVSDLATVFRGVSYWATSEIHPVQDSPADIAYVYTPANVVDGVFNYTGTAKKVRHTVALVSWNDVQDFGRVKIEYVDDPEGIARYGVQQTDLTAVGCTSQGQAQRAGRYALLTALYETDTVTFSVGIGGTLTVPGQVIKIADPVRAGKRMGGRVVSATTTQIVLDGPADAVAGNTFTIISSAGVPIARTVQSVSADKKTITVSLPFPEAPAPATTWLVEASNLVAQTYRVVGVTEDTESKTFTVTAVMHNASKFSAVDNRTKIDIPQISDIPASVQVPPTGIRIEAMETASKVIASTVLEISWNPAEGAVNYDVDVRMDNGEWQTVASKVTGRIARMQFAVAGTYVARVRARNAINILSQPAYSAETIISDQTKMPGFVEDLDDKIDAGDRLVGDRVTQETADRIREDARVASEAADDATAKAQAAGDAAFAAADASATLKANAAKAEAVAESAIVSQAKADAALAAAKADANAQLDVIRGTLDTVSAQIGDILEADEWVSTKDYPKGDLVQFEGKLYRADYDVPAGTPLSNDSYWQRLGDYSGLSGAVAANIAMTNLNTSDIWAQSNIINSVVARMPTGTDQLITAAAVNTIATALAGADVAAASRLTNIETRLPVGTGQLASAQSVSDVSARVTTVEGNITAQTSRVDSIQATLSTGDNLVPTDLGDGAVLEDGVSVVTSSAQWSPNSRSFDVREGDTLDISGSVRANAAMSYIRLAIRFDGPTVTNVTRNTQMSNPVVGTWNDLSFTTVVPAGATRAAVRAEAGGAVSKSLRRPRVVVRSMADTANAQAIDTLNTSVSTIDGKVTAITSRTSVLEATTSALSVAGLKAFNRLEGKDDWVFASTTEAAPATVIAETSAASGYVLHVGDDVGNDMSRGRFKAMIPFDPNKLYRVRYRYRRLSGTGSVYLGMYSETADRTQSVNANNALQSLNAITGLVYFASNQTPAFGVWQEGTYYFKGRSAGASSGAGTLASPRLMPASSAYFCPAFLLNFNGQTGQQELDYMSIEEVDYMAADADITATIVANETASVTRDNALGTRTSAIETRMPTGTDQLATSAQITAAEQASSTRDEALATQMTQLRASLEGEVQNLVTNGDFAAGLDRWITSGGVNTATYDSTEGALYGFNPNSEIRVANNVGIAVVPGKTYQIAITYKTNEAYTGWNSGGVGFVSNPTTTSWIGSAIQASQITKSTSYRTITANVTLPANSPTTLYARIANGGITGTNAAIWIKEIKITGAVNLAELQAQNVANAASIASTDAKVTAVEGQVTAVANRTTQLEARMPTGVGKVATEASVTALQSAMTSGDAAVAQTVTDLTARFSNFARSGVNMLEDGGWERQALAAPYVSSPTRTGIRARSITMNNAAQSMDTASVEAQPDRVYYMEAWVTATTATTNTTNAIQLQGRMGTSSGALITSRTAGTLRAADVPVGEWVKISGVMHTNNSPTVRQLVVRLNFISGIADGTFVVDDILLIDVTEAYNAQTTADQATARITAEETARANADTAQASRITAIETRMPTGSDKLANEARVTAIENASVTRDEANATAIAGLSASFTQAAGDNLLANSSFEEWDGTNNTNAYRGWTVNVGNVGTSRANLQAATISPRGKGMAARMTATGTATNTPYIGLLQPVTGLKEGQPYTLSAWFQNPGAGTPRVILEALNASGGVISGTAQTTGTTSTDPQFLSVTRTLPVGTVTLRAYVRVQGSANVAGQQFDASFDDVKLQTGTVATAWTQSNVDNENSVSVVTARIATEETARANADTALASRATALEARMPTGSGKVATEASVTNLQTAMTTADGALASSITAVDTKAGNAQTTATTALTAANDAATAITSVKANQTGGGNLLDNADFGGNGGALAGAWSWASLMWAGINGQVNLSPTEVGVPSGTNSFGIVAPGNPSGANYLDSKKVTAAQGDVFIASAYLCNHRNLGHVEVVFLDVNGNIIDYKRSPQYAAAGGKAISGWARAVAVSNPAPAGTVQAFLRWGTESPGTNPYAWIAMAMLEKAAPGQTYPSPWSAGATGLSQATFSLQAGLNAKWGVTLDVNGYISGIESTNNGVRSEVNILADRFRIVSPAGGQRTEYSDGNWRIYDNNGVMRVRLGVW